MVENSKVYNRVHFLLVLCLFISSPTSAENKNIASSQSCQKADFAIYNTTVYTVDERMPKAEAVAVLGNKIVFVGSNTALLSSVCKDTELMDMAGNYVYPGFSDSHQHVEGVGERPKTLSLFSYSSLKDTVAAIEDFAQQVPVGHWVQGRGWIEREWTDEQRFLNKWDVDHFTADKPLFMPRADGVSALVNSKALALAGIDKNTPDPEGGKFERDEKGEATGYVLATAMEIFRKLIPPKTREYKKHSLIQGMAINAKQGWTATQDAGMPFVNIELMKEIQAQGNMSTRIYAAANVQESEKMFAHGSYVSDDHMFEVRGIKVYIDGTLGSRGAALLQNYADANHRGFMNRTSKNDLDPILRQALREGIQIQTHVIGDRAVRSLLNWYEAAFNDVSYEERAVKDPRWRLEHVQIITPEDQQKMITLGVIPSMQPSHGIGDLNFALARLGLKRLEHAYPWQKLIEQGSIILGGSDAPVELGDPRIEFYAAVARKRLDGTSGRGWHPESAVSREDALKMFTIWPAYGAFQENIRGSIEVGKLADFTIMDTDWLHASEEKILSSENQMTIVGGKITYQKG
ncbi:amidohydrolase [Ningiella sp. W23]|uniref:amidohydrolase n=1 Tax=Ningiella sp. W23 TaxID=3023715 RepID=UPI003757A233